MSLIPFPSLLTPKHFRLFTLAVGQLYFKRQSLQFAHYLYRILHHKKTELIHSLKTHHFLILLYKKHNQESFITYVIILYHGGNLLHNCLLEFTASLFNQSFQPIVGYLEEVSLTMRYCHLMILPWHRPLNDWTISLEIIYGRGSFYFQVPTSD